METNCFAKAEREKIRAALMESMRLAIEVREQSNRGPDARIEALHSLKSAPNIMFVAVAINLEDVRKIESEIDDAILRIKSGVARPEPVIGLASLKTVVDSMTTEELAGHTED